MSEAATLTGPAANKGKNAAGQSKSFRFMVTFPEKYAEAHRKIADAANDADREPGEYLVRWLAKHYDPAKLA